jgi:hypothetical protein
MMGALLEERKRGPENPASPGSHSDRNTESAFLKC